MHIWVVGLEYRALNTVCHCTVLSCVGCMHETTRSTSACELASLLAEWYPELARNGAVTDMNQAGMYVIRWSVNKVVRKNCGLVSNLVCCEAQAHYGTLSGKVFWGTYETTVFCR